MKADGEWKVCSKCKLSRELAWFAHSKNESDGFYRNCKECKRVIDRKRYERRKAKCLIQLTGTGVCTKCKETKEINNFSVSYLNKNGRMSWCYECFKGHKKERYWQKPELSREKAREFNFNYYWKSDGRLISSLKYQAKKGYS